MKLPENISKDRDSVRQRVVYLKKGIYSAKSKLGQKKQFEGQI